jgi:hypothetical protein
MNLALSFWWFACLWGGPVLVATPAPSFGACQPEHPVLTVAAVVNRVDTTACYVVLKATAVADGHRYTVLSPRTGTVLRTPSGSSPARIVLGGRYTFRLQATALMQVSPAGPPLFLNLRSFNIGSIHIVDAGELPYLALNMRGFNIH